MRLIFLSFKRNILPFLLIAFAFCLVIFSKSNLIATKNGLLLWANNVVPSLFPFFVITELLSHTSIIHHIGKWCDKLMRPIFNVPGEAAFPFIMGFISGYPTGGKIVADLRSQGLCSKDEGNRMLAFMNNSGPLFIISFVGVSLFGDTKTGILLLCTHILASITVGIILGKFSTKVSTNKSNLPISSVSKKSEVSISKESMTLSNFGRLLGDSIQKATSTILLIGGFVVIFSVVISILTQTHLLDYFRQLLKPILAILGFDLDFAKPILAGIVELTNGVHMVASISIKAVSQNVILCAFLLGFGGISVLFQVFSMISQTDLSMKKYVIGKFLQGIFAAIYTFLALNFIPMLNLDVVQTCAPIAEVITYPIHFFGISNYVILLFVILFIVCAAFSIPHAQRGRKTLSI